MVIWRERAMCWKDGESPVKCHMWLCHEIEACPVHDELRIKISCEKHPEREHLSPGKISLDRPHLHSTSI